MMSSLLRTSFNSSRLIRFLADLSLGDAAESRQDFAERLSQWLDFSDAITLHTAHDASATSSAATQSETKPVAGVAVEDEFARVRTTLVNSITTSCSPSGGGARIKLPSPKPGAAMAIGAPYEPYHRFYLAHQGDMELSVRPLRNSVRQALARTSARLRQLAVMDEALERILGVRERQMLATVPLLLERRFERLLKVHPQPLADTRQADGPELPLPPGGGLAEFSKELQGVLLAELDLRLQPTRGLIEALRNGTDKHK